MKLVRQMRCTHRAWRLLVATLILLGCEQQADKTPAPPRDSSSAVATAQPGRPKPACGAIDTMAPLTPELLESLEFEPQQAAAKLQRYRSEPATSPGRLAWELSQWAAAAQGSFTQHLEPLLGSRGTPVAAQTMCTLLGSAAVAAKNERGGVAATYLAAWLDHRKPSLLSATEVQVVRKVYSALLAAPDGDVLENLVFRVLAQDPGSEFIALMHVGCLQGEELIDFVEKIQARHPGTTWLRELALDIPVYMTRGDWKNPKLVERLTRTVSQFGELSMDDARRRMADGRAGKLKYSKKYLELLNE